MPRQRLPDLPVAALIVDRLNAQMRLVRVVHDVEQAELPDQPRAEELQHEAFVPEVGPAMPQRAHRVAVASDIREPLLILGRRFGANPLDVLHHREPQRIGVQAGIARIVEVGLEHDIGVGPQELHHCAVGQLTLFVQPVHDPVMDVGRAALIHDLGLRLRVEVLRDHPHDAQQFALPWHQPRGGLLKEIENILLRQLQ